MVLMIIIYLFTYLPVKPKCFVDILGSGITKKLEAETTPNI
jgi:hypothetical protein